MNLLHRLAHRFRTLFLKRKLEREMAEEMRFHLEERAADQIADGLPPDEARYAAQRKFGNLAGIQQQAREGRGWMWLEDLLKDIHLGARILLKSPGFTFIAILTLGLGIGANTSMFSVLNGLMLKPLPYADLAQLDRLWRGTPQNPGGNFSLADFLALREAKEGYGDFAGYTAANVSLAEPGHPAEMAYAARATANLFSFLGVTPQLGRDFRPGEDTPGRDRVVILSQRVWHNRFGGARNVIGRTVRIDGEPHVIIGVLPQSFNDWRSLGMMDFFRPLVFTPEQAADRKATGVRIIGRRAPARSTADASVFIASFGARLAKEFPEANAEATWRTEPLQSTATGQGGSLILPMLVGLSGFVLLIACSNLANLLLAHTMARAREFAVRAALGASRTQLLRPLITEALLLAFAGAILAILVTFWFRDWTALRSTGDNGEHVDFAVDGHVMLWAFGASLFTALAFGLAPALFALRLNLNATLKSGGRSTTGGRGHQRFRQILIIGQFALAMVLLAGAGLFIRGLDDLNNRRSGWESQQLVSGTFLLPTADYGTAEKIAAFQKRTLERIATLPGVASVSLSSFTPFYNWPDVRKFITEGQDRPQSGREPAAAVNCVSPQYFDTYGTHLLSGRAFTDRDTANAPGVFIISAATARDLFGDQNPIGRRLAQLDGTALRWGEIVGVAADVQSVIADANPVVFQVYTPLAQELPRQNEIAVRAVGVAPSTLVSSVLSAMAALDPDLPVRKLQTADTAISRANYQLAVLRDMLIGFAVLGLGLASLGIYGVITRTMAQRTGEFAVRLALGASVRDIIRLVLGTGVRQAIIGSVLGLAGAFGVSRIITSAFPRLPTNSPAIFAATAVLLVVIALLACWLPARRAGKIDAMTALRAE